MWVPECSSKDTAELTSTDPSHISFQTHLSYILGKSCLHLPSGAEAHNLRKSSSTHTCPQFKLSGTERCLEPEAALGTCMTLPGVTILHPSNPFETVHTHWCLSIQGCWKRMMSGIDAHIAAKLAGL